MKVKKMKAYKCNNCEEIYEDEEDAIECCPSSDEIDGFLCGQCNNIYEDKDEAKECCK